MKFLWRSPQEIMFGAGRVQRVGRWLTGANVRRVLLVSDQGVRGAGLLNPVLAHLQEHGLPYVLYTDVVPNPTVANVKGALGLLQASGCEAVAAVGGGSVIDVGKMVAVMARNPGDVESYAGSQRFSRRPLPFVAVGTTAGTGSEVTQYAIITGGSGRDARKLIFRGAELVPALGLVDPELTYGLPPRLTAATGMDALTHALEALVATGASPMSDNLARDAALRIATHLPTAYQEPDNQEARAAMSYAQMLAGLAFSNAGLGVIHALAHQLGALHSIAHGVANALLLPHGLLYNSETVGADYADLAGAMGLSPTAEALIEHCEALLEQLELPRRLRDVNVPEEDLPQLATMALDDMAMNGNPRPAEQRDLLALLQRAY